MSLKCIKHANNMFGICVESKSLSSEPAASKKSSTRLGLLELYENSQTAQFHCSPNYMKIRHYATIFWIFIILLLVHNSFMMFNLEVWESSEIYLEMLTIFDIFAKWFSLNNLQIYTHNIWSSQYFVISFLEDSNEFLTFNWRVSCENTKT